MSPSALDIVNRLLNDKVAEKKTLDYKRDLPAATLDDRKEFLADVSSFANTEGGILLYGIGEKNGIPTTIEGLKAADLDAEQLRLQSMLLDGLQPRLPDPPEIEVLPNLEGHRLLVVRISRSWLGPHRVVLGGHGHFYGRVSSGKYRLDVAQLREAFLRSETLVERLKAFRVERALAVNQDQTPIQIERTPTQVLHLVPMSAFASEDVDISGRLLSIASSRIRSLKPLGRPSHWDQRVNLEGRLVFSITASAHATCRSYTQYYRRGIIEAVGTLPTAYKKDLSRYPYVITSQWLPELREFLNSSLSILRELDQNPPFFIFLSLLRMKGYTLADTPHSHGVGFLSPRGDPFAMNELLLDSVVVEEFATDTDRLLWRLLDVVWNAVGVENCPYFEATGKWIG